MFTKWAGFVQQRIVTESATFPRVDIVSWQQESFSMLVCLLQRKWLFISKKNQHTLQSHVERSPWHQRSFLRNCVGEGNEKVSKPFRQSKHGRIEVFWEGLQFDKLNSKYLSHDWKLCTKQINHLQLFCTVAVCTKASSWWYRKIASVLLVQLYLILPHDPASDPSVALLCAAFTSERLSWKFYHLNKHQLLHD